MSTIAIIGAGMGGLVAGNLLVKKGHKVTIFESHTAPGGYTAGFWKKGYYFESGTVSFESSAIINQTMQELGVQDKINFSRQHIRWMSSHFDVTIHSLDELQTALLEAFPDQRNELNRLFADVDTMWRRLVALGSPNSLVSSIIYPFKLIGYMGFLKKYDRMTLPEFCAQYLDTGSAAYRLLSGMGYPDMSAIILAGALMTFVHDYWTVKTGMQSWADVLADNFRAHGGELELGTMVETIITKASMATGVRTKDREYPADYVISASDFKKTFFQLLDDRSMLPDEFTEKIKNAAVSESFFTVYCGINLPREKMEAYMRIPHIFYYDDHESYDIYNSGDDRFFEKTSPTLYSPSLMNQDLAPAGKSSLMIQTYCPHRWMDNWGGGDRTRYKELKQRAQKAMIGKVSHIIPDLEKYLDFVDAATPLTYERYTHNTDGASSAWSWNPKKRIYKNMMRTQVITPVKNLLIGSCWGAQIGGVPNAILAARACADKVT